MPRAKYYLWNGARMNVSAILRHLRSQGRRIAWYTVKGYVEKGYTQDSDIPSKRPRSYLKLKEHPSIVRQQHYEQFIEDMLSWEDKD